MSRRVPFTARQMFDLVADVERYPEFVPLCEGLMVHSRQVNEDRAVLVATMSVGYRSIRESFTTKVDLRPAHLAIDVAYLDGPFRRLDNTWRFTDLARGSDIKFHIDYEFRSRLLAMVMGSVFDQAFRKFGDAFEDRARVIYGAPDQRAAN